MSRAARTQELLQAARQEVEPTADELRRLRARLATRLATEEPEVVPSVIPWRTLVGLLALAGLGLTVFWAAPAPPAPPPAVAVNTCPAPTVCAAAPSPAACPPPPPVEPRPVLVRSVPAACPPPATVTPAPVVDESSSRHLETTALAEDEQNRWANELGLLVDARVAIDESRPLDALGHTRRHAQLFPDSAFLQERLALEVLATCQFGRPDLAVDTAERLLEESPDSPYTPRIRASCNWPSAVLVDAGAAGE